MLDYPLAEWIPAAESNYMVAKRPSEPCITMIVVHVMQGTLDGTIRWFQNPVSGVSAHYNIGINGRTVQTVEEKDIAYHAGFPNKQYNWWSIGIEHEGYINQAEWFTDEMYEASSNVTAYLCNKYNIPVTRYSIIGHNELPGQAGRREDPGPYWNWNKYMELVDQKFKALQTPVLPMPIEPIPIEPAPIEPAPILLPPSTPGEIQRRGIIRKR